MYKIEGNENGKSPKQGGGQHVMLSGLETIKRKLLNY